MITPQYLLTLFSILVSFATIQLRNDWPFRDELIRGLDSPRDTIYVEDRRNLIRVSKASGKGRSVAFSNSELGILIYLRNTPFNAKHHTIDRAENIIDGDRAYGIEGTIPDRQLSDIKILWDTTVLSVPLKAYSGLYNLWLSNPLAISPEAYVTRDGTLLYIYLSGADGAAGYSVKLVFNRKRYLTRLITTNECMDGFDFLDGHGDCSR